MTYEYFKMKNMSKNLQICKEVRASLWLKVKSLPICILFPPLI